MLPDLLPGNRYSEELQRRLETLALESENTRGRQIVDGDRSQAYLTFCHDSTTMLRHALTRDSIDRLLLTRRYWAILDLGAYGRATGELVDLELVDCASRLRAAAKAVEEERHRWEATGTVVVPDTNVFLHALSGTIAEADWRSMIQARSLDTVTVVLLMAVIDELDNTKRTNDRSKARVTLNEIDRLLGVGFRVLLTQRTASGGEIYLAVMLDPPGHEPLSHTDSEIIDRTLALGQRAFGEVHLVTGDTGMMIRARQAELRCHKVETP